MSLRLLGGGAWEAGSSGGFASGSLLYKARGRGEAPTAPLRRAPRLPAEKQLKGDAWRDGGYPTRVPAARAAAPSAAAAAAGDAAASRWPAGRRRLLPRGALEPRVTAAGAASAHRVAGAQRGPRVAGYSGRAGAAAAPAGAHRAVVSATLPGVSGLLPRRRVHAALCLLFWYRAGRLDPCVSSASCPPIGRARPTSALCLHPLGRG